MKKVCITGWKTPVERAGEKQDDIPEFGMPKTNA